MRLRLRQPWLQVLGQHQLSLHPQGVRPTLLRASSCLGRMAKCTHPLGEVIHNQVTILTPHPPGDVDRWLLDSGSIVQPIEAADSLEEEAERELLSTAGTAHRALRHAAAPVGEPWQQGVGRATEETAQLQSVLGLLFGGQVRGFALRTWP